MELRSGRHNGAKRNASVRYASTHGRSTSASAREQRQEDHSVDDIKASMAKLSGVLIRHLMPEPKPAEEIVPPLFEKFKHLKRFVKGENAS